METIGRLQYALSYLSLLFEYLESLRFEKNIDGESLLGIRVFKDKEVIFEDVIESPITYRKAGKFVGVILYEQVNPGMKWNKEEKRRSILKRFKESNLINHLTKPNIAQRVERFVIQASGRAVAESMNESYAPAKIQMPEERINRIIRESLAKQDEILDRIYNIRGEKIINDIAKLGGMEARIKILEVCGIDICPEEEQ